MIVLLQLIGIIMGIVLMILPMGGLALYSLIEDDMTAVQKVLYVVGFFLVYLAQFFGVIYYFNLIG